MPCLPKIPINNKSPINTKKEMRYTHQNLLMCALCFSAYSLSAFSFSLFSSLRSSCCRSINSITVSKFPFFYLLFGAFSTIHWAPQYWQYAFVKLASTCKLPLHWGQIAVVNSIFFLNNPMETLQIKKCAPRRDAWKNAPLQCCDTISLRKRTENTLLP